MSNYGFASLFLVPYLLATYENQPSQWYTNCAGNLTDALRQIDLMNLGSKFEMKYVTFVSEKITCAMREIDRQKSAEKSNKIYTDIFQLFANSFDDAKKQFISLVDNDLVFFYYLQILANVVQKQGYTEIADVLRKLLERTRIMWGYPYDIAFSFDATKSNAIIRPLNQNLTLISKYNRQAKKVSFLRPQISRKNVIRIGIASSVLLLSMIVYRRWGK